MPDIQDMTNAAQEKIRGYLAEIYPDYVDFEDGTYTVNEGSAIISVTVRPWYENDIVIEFASQLVSNADINETTMKWLLEKNVDLHFGALGLLFDGTIVYSQALPGACLNKEAVQATVRTVAMIADHYDDEIIAMAGGTLASEASDSMEETEESAG